MYHWSCWADRRFGWLGQDLDSEIVLGYCSIWLTKNTKSDGLKSTQKKYHGKTIQWCCVWFWALQNQTCTRKCCPDWKKNTLAPPLLPLPHPMEVFEHEFKIGLFPPFLSWSLFLVVLPCHPSFFQISPNIIMNQQGKKHARPPPDSQKGGIAWHHFWRCLDVGYPI